jgi:hypothetical protein
MNDISVDQVINYLFKLDKDSSLAKNKMALGLVANKLLLAFKNKPGFLEELVLKCSPSLMNILQNIKRIMVEKGYAKIPELQKNKETYINQMKTNPNVNVEGKLLCQEHLEKGRKEKIAVIVVPEIRERMKKDYPHPTIELKFDKD